MARTDQYVGLTDDAREWVAGADRSEMIELCPSAFDEQPVTGFIYYFDKREDKKAIVAKETIQAIPWSSGPMYFTCLEVALVQEEGFEDIHMGKYFEWVVNPMLDREVDARRGHYWV